MLSACPRVGPTEAIIDALERVKEEPSSVPGSRPGVSRAGLVEGAFGPDGPGDAGELVGQRRGGAIVAPALVETKGPGLETIGMASFVRGEEDGPGAVDQERAQVGVSTFVDRPEAVVVAARVLSGCQAEIACVGAAGAEAVGGADESEHGRGGDDADAGHRDKRLCSVGVGEQGLELSIEIADLLVELPDFLGDQREAGEDDRGQFGSDLGEAWEDAGPADRDDVTELTKDRPQGVGPCRAGLDEGRAQAVEEGDRLDRTGRIASRRLRGSHGIGAVMLVAQTTV